LKFKPNHTWISFKLGSYIVRYHQSIVAVTVTLGVSHSHLRTTRGRWQQGDKPPSPIQKIVN
jgi:hypothetical protein